MALNFDLEEANESIIYLLQRAYQEAPDLAAWGSEGTKPGGQIVPCSQLALMMTPDKQYLLGIGCGALKIPLLVPLAQIRELHAQLGAILSSPN